MQTVAQSIQTIADGSIQVDGFVVERIADDLTWGVGSIRPQIDSMDDVSQTALITTVLKALEEVSAAEKPYSACTDGRAPVRLLNDDAVPVREQVVGTDTMLIFHMAEVLGARFYKNPDAPLRERLTDVVEFMKENGLVPCAHIACGAAAGYVPITQNLVTFTTNPQFIARQQALLPDGVYDQDLRQQITIGYQDRLSRGVYDGWDAAQIVDIVRAASGERAISELNDDGRGIQGHVEEQIIRIQLDGRAINEATVTSRTHGREVFGVNDLRLQRLARLMGRGQDTDYRLALMAAEDFTDGGHGTLAKDLPTYVIRSIR